MRLFSSPHTATLAPEPPLNLPPLGDGQGGLAALSMENLAGLNGAQLAQV